MADPSRPDSAASPPAPLSTVLLRHETGAGVHYDWLIIDPRTLDDPDAPLWTARVAHPSPRWISLGELELEPLAPHRRAYLTYEGPLTGGRGWVTRVDEGDAIPRAWTDDRIVLRLEMRGCRAFVEMRRESPERWRATVRAEA